jgi:hypothetical protein
MAFETISLWRALFLAIQIWSQATVAKSWNKWVSDKGIPTFSGCRIIYSHSTIEDIHKAKMSKGQKEFRQTTLAIGQEKNKWNIESVGKEYKEQEVSIVEFRI